MGRNDSNEPANVRKERGRACCGGGQENGGPTVFGGVTYGGLSLEVRGFHSRESTFAKGSAGKGDYLVGLGYVGGYGFGEVGVELGGVFFCEEVRDALFRFFQGGAFGVDGGGAVHQVLEILFPEVEFLFAVHYVAVAAQDRVEIEFFCGVQRLDPVVGIGVAHERSPAVEGVAGGDEFFVGEEDEDVTIGVGAA